MEPACPRGADAHVIGRPHWMQSQPINSLAILSSDFWRRLPLPVDARDWIARHQSSDSVLVLSLDLNISQQCYRNDAGKLNWIPDNRHLRRAPSMTRCRMREPA
jgi:hypothetical protein